MYKTCQAELSFRQQCLLEAGLLALADALRRSALSGILAEQVNALSRTRVTSLLIQPSI